MPTSKRAIVSAVGGWALAIAVGAGMVAATIDTSTPPTTTTTTTSSSSTTSTTAGTTTTTSPPQGVATCDPSKGTTDELCWFQNTGVLNLTTQDANDRWTEAQMLTGQASAQMTEVFSHTTPYVVHLTQAGSTYENKIVHGCIAIEANNITIQNVLVVDGQHVAYDGTENSACHAAGCNCGGGIVSGNGNATGTIIRNVEIDGDGNGTNGSCAAPPWDYSTCVPILLSGANMNMALENGTYLVQQVNSHGGYVNGTGWMANGGGGVQVEDSYFHEIGHMHKTCYPGCWSTLDDFHRDILFAQHMSNWSITHSYLQYLHGTWDGNTNPGWLGGDGYSGGCLCNETGDNWVFDNVFIDGTPHGSSIADEGTHTKIVMQNVYAVTGISQLPTAFSDYAAGAWTPSYTNNRANVPGSRCNGIFDMTRGSAVPTRVAC